MSVELAGYPALVRIHAAARPAGPSIVALHGFTGSGEDFDPLRQAVGDEQVTWICPDFMGHGGSASPGVLDPYLLPMALQLIDRARAMAPDPARVMLLAYSMGGRLALHYLLRAARLPALLLGASPGLQSAQERQTRREEDGKWLRLLGAGSPAFCEEWEAQPLIAPQKRIPEPGRSAVARRRRSNNPVGLAHSLLACGTGALPGLWDAVPRLPPAVIAHGAEDAKFAAIAGRMAAANASLEPLPVPGSGHAPHLEAPDALAAILSDFLRATVGRP